MGVKVESQKIKELLVQIATQSVWVLLMGMYWAVTDLNVNHWSLLSLQTSHMDRGTWTWAPQSQEHQLSLWFLHSDPNSSLTKGFCRPVHAGPELLLWQARGLSQSWGSPSREGPDSTLSATGRQNTRTLPNLWSMPVKTFTTTHKLFSKWPYWTRRKWIINKVSWKCMLSPRKWFPLLHFPKNRRYNPVRLMCAANSAMCHRHREFELPAGSGEMKALLILWIGLGIMFFCFFFVF